MRGQSIEIRPKEIMWDNAQFATQPLKCSQSMAIEIVGGKKRLFRLIEEGKIEAEKKCAKKNGKWMCNLSQVLSHARCAPRTA